jgi:hypothetical protein
MKLNVSKQELTNISPPTSHPKSFESFNRGHQARQDKLDEGYTGIFAVPTTVEWA